MEVTFRTATRDDLPDVVALINQCFDEQNTVEYAVSEWERSGDDPHQIYINGYLDGELVAHLKITIIPTIYDDMATYAMLNHVCVRPDVRRHHLGTKLLDEAFVACRDAGATKVVLWSKNFREAAHAMYKKYGFEVVDAKFFERKI